MNNDYYLQQILQEMGSLDDILDNQKTIIENQQALISGDKQIEESLCNIYLINTTILVVALTTLIYNFVTKCWRC